MRKIMMKKCKPESLRGDLQLANTHPNLYVNDS